VTNRDEMHGDWPNTVERLATEETYREEFARVFGKETIEPADVAHALAEFVRSIQSRGQSRFDQFVAGEHDKLTDEEILGLHLFRTKASCMNCHHGPFFTDHLFHDLGLSYFGRQLEDLGRYNITQDPAHSGQFKTPSLRNVTRTAPYMHVGLFPLRGVLNLYNAGMPTIKATEEQKADPRLPKKSHLLKPLNLSLEEIQAIEAFLHTLEEPARRVRTPKFPPIAADN
jgi:cytochrome c peroxidase